MSSTVSHKLIGWCLTIVMTICYTAATAQSLTTSNLPIVVITTNGMEIPDEPKVAGTMTIYYDQDGGTNTIGDSAHYSGTIGIERRGQTSLSLFPKNGFGIETRTPSGDNDNVKLFGWPRENDWIIHSPYSDKSLLRNKLTYTLAADFMDYAPRTQLCELILNDEYYGVIVFTEKIKRDDDRVDISRLSPNATVGDSLTGGYILRFDKGSEDDVAWVSPFPPLEDSWQETRFIFHYPDAEDYNPQQLFYIRKYITDFENALRSPDFQDSSVGYPKYIDPATFIDYMLVNEMARNVDGYRLSTYMYKDQLGKLKLGPVWDFNIAWGNVDYCNGSSIEGWAYDFNNVCPGDFWQVHFWWQRLLEDPDYADALADRWKELRLTTLSDQRLVQLVDSLAAVLDQPQQRNYERWPVLGTYVWPNNFVGDSYAEEVDYLKEWMLQRAAWLDDNIGEGTATHTTTSKNYSTILFPNPSTGSVTITDCTSCHLQLYTSDGSLGERYAVEHGVVQLSVRPGLYFYQVRDVSDELVSSGRLVVE